MILISPSALSADFANLESSVRKIAVGGANYLHLDVMDGQFVPNLGIAPCVIKSLRPKSKLVFDVHLMIEEPSRYYDSFIKAGADIITIHYEACRDLDASLDLLKDKQMKVGLAFSPATPVDKILPYVDKVDMVLVMTVVPGFGGQKLIPETIDKVREVRKYINAHNLRCDIEVDGGVTAENVGQLTAAGANVIVAGSAIFGAKRPKAVMNAMRQAAENNPFHE